MPPSAAQLRQAIVKSPVMEHPGSFENAPTRTDSPSLDHVWVLDDLAHGGDAWAAIEAAGKKMKGLLGTPQNRNAGLTKEQRFILGLPRNTYEAASKTPNLLRFKGKRWASPFHLSACSQGNQVKIRLLAFETGWHPDFKDEVKTASKRVKELLEGKAPVKSASAQSPASSSVPATRKPAAPVPPLPSKTEPKVPGKGQQLIMTLVRKGELWIGILDEVPEGWTNECSIWNQENVPKDVAESMRAVIEIQQVKKTNIAGSFRRLA